MTHSRIYSFPNVKPNQIIDGKDVNAAIHFYPY